MKPADEVRIVRVRGPPRLPLPGVLSPSFRNRLTEVTDQEPVIDLLGPAVPVRLRREHVYGECASASIYPGGLAMKRHAQNGVIERKVSGT